MQRLFRKKPIDNDTLTMLVKPRHELIDAKHKEIIDFLNEQKNEILSEANSDEDIIKNAWEKRVIIESMVKEYVTKVLNQTDDGCDYDQKIIFQARCIYCLDTPKNVSVKDRLKLRFTTVKHLIDEHTVTAKENICLEAVESIQRGTNKNNHGFSGRK